MKNFDVLVFDLGGVLIDWDGTTPLVELSAGRLDREAARRFWIESPWVTQYDQGQCTVEQFADGVIGELQLKQARTDFIAAYRTWVKAPYPGAEALLQCLSRRYRLATLTNNNAIHFEHITQQLSLERYFSQIFASHLIGMKKPDPAIYRYVTEQLGVAPERIAFFDDNLECIAPARALGWQAFHTVGLLELERALISLGA